MFREEDRPDCRRRFALHGGSDVAVEVREQRGISVAQALGRDLGRNAGRQHQRGAGVPQPVGSQAGKAELARQAAKHPGEVLGWYGPPPAFVNT